MNPAIGGLGSMYSHCYELVGFFVREPPPKSMKYGRDSGHRQVYKKNILEGFQRPTGDDRLHNAAKPVAMLAQLIENSSDEGELVLDLFNGSGSVIIAGERTGRRVRAMEMEPTWCDVTAARWERETGLEAQLERDGEIVAHEFPDAGSPPRKPGKRRKAPEDGNKRQARRRVQTLIQSGELKRPADVTCVDCEDAPGREYDHHLGYGAAHHEDVEALCASCHHKREASRENEKAPA